MASRRQGREHALQVLFQIDMTGDSPNAALESHWRDREIESATREFASLLVTGASSESDRIDALIRRSSENWRIERMAAVDRNVLRVAIYELLHERETPPPVIINEAIEIAKRYGGEESGQFVNGVLDSVRKELDRPAGRETSEQSRTRLP